jgi:aminopyrrolnitrin oxygenase
MVNIRTMNIAASWYVAMRSTALTRKPKAIELFGQPLVTWRNQEGCPVIMERYCSHMGASLALGKIVSGCIQCPFHRWHFDSTGNCVAIPDIDKIPLMASQHTYVTIERYGFVWIWYGSKDPMFSLPEFPSVEDERSKYMLLHYSFNAKTTVRRVVENIYDHYHLSGLHNLKITNSFELTLLNNQHLEQQSEIPIDKDAWFGSLIEARIERYLGLIGAMAHFLGLNTEVFTLRVDGWPSGHIVTSFINGEETGKLLSGITPISENETIWQMLITVKKTGSFWKDLLYYALFGLQGIVSGAQDLPVWNTLKSDGGRAYTKHDLGVLKFREFYQSWVNKVEYSDSTSVCTKI